MVNYFKNLSIFILFFLFIQISTVTGTGLHTPHSAYGLVKYSDGSIPATITLNAYITTRPSEILNHNSVGCGYDSITGTWFIGCSNFPTSWEIEDTLHVDIEDIHNLTATVEVVLTGAPADSCTIATLAQPTITINIKTQPESLSYYVDGTLYNSEVTFYWLQGSIYTIGTDSLILYQTNSRYSFQNWSNNQSRNQQFQVPNISSTLTATFNTQHELTIESPYGQSYGEGWHIEGSSVEFGVIAEVDTISEGRRFIFLEWKGEGEQSYSGALSNTTIILNNPVRETAVWEEQFRLQAKTIPLYGGQILKSPSQDWYPKNSQVTLTAIPNEEDAFVFSGWSGSISSTDNPLVLQMETGIEIYAEFRNNDYIPPILTKCYPIDGAADIPQNSPVLFEITDFSPSSGLDSSNILIKLNSDTLFYNGMIWLKPDTNNITAIIKKSDILFYYNQNYNFIPDQINNIHIMCEDYSNPPNRLDTTVSFNVSSIEILDKSVFPIPDLGATITFPNSNGASLSIPPAAVDSLIQIYFGSIRNAPAPPQTASLIGDIVYLGPDGYSFQDSVTLKLKYTQDILNRSGSTHPLDIPVYSYSTITGKWRQVLPFRFTSNYLYTKIIDTGIYSLGTQHLTAIEENTLSDKHSRHYALLQNYPNPFNNSTVISFVLEQRAHVEISIYDIQGREVKKLLNADQTQGEFRITWDGKINTGQNAASGIYFCTIKSNGFNSTIKLLITR